MGKIADISKYQGKIDWASARAELDFCILRASCGMSMDTRYTENAQSCGIPFGVYHYVKAGTAEEARAEARFFVDCVHQTNPQPVFLIADIEYEAQTESTTEPVCVSFLETLRELGCEKIGLYINRKYKWAGSAIGLCDIVWIPHWGLNDGNVPAEKYMPKHPCDLWQYTSKGRLTGVKGYVDLNLLSGEKTLDFFTRKDGGLKMDMSIQRVIDLAKREVGYLEKATNAQLDDKTANAGNKNFTKYARDLAAIPYFNGSKTGVAWCAVFVCWCFVQAYGADAARKLLCQPSAAKDNTAAGCNSAMKFFKARGRLFDDPNVGDQVFFWNSSMTEASHTGIVVAVDKAYVYTIEGNTSGSSGVIANGGMVCEKKYALGYGRIAGYGSPDWSLDSVQSNDTPVTGKELIPLYKATVTSPGKYLNLRAKKSKQSASIANMPRGAVVEVLDDSDSSWWLVSYSGKTGYAMTQSGSDVYLTPSGSADSGSVTLTLTLEKIVALALFEALRKAVGG